MQNANPPEGLASIDNYREQMNSITIRAILTAAIFLLFSVTSECATFRFHRTDASSNHLLVFLHGVGGDETTFGSWPRLAEQDIRVPDLGPSFAKYETGLISYDSKGGSTSTAHDLAVEVRSVLCEQILSTGKQIFLVSHSLGGLLLKKALVDIKRSEGCDGQKLTNLKAVIFLSTPSDGADLANSAGALGKIVRYVGKAVDDLKNISGNAWLQSLGGDWKNLYEGRKPSDYRIYCAFEKRSTYVSGFSFLFVVPEERVDKQCDVIRGFEKDHRTIAKPEQITDAVYDWVRNRIVDSQRSRGKVILAMDSSPNAYNASLKDFGKSNAVIYQRQLEKLKTVDKLDIEVERETTHQGWDEEEVAFRRNLALIVIHLSAFEFNAQECVRKKIGMGCSGPSFLPFLRAALRKNIPVIIYSRVDLCSRSNAEEFLKEFHAVGGGDTDQLYFVSFERKPGTPTPTYLDPADWDALRVVAMELLDPAKRSYSGSRGCNLVQAARS
jgi:pimeloyl-ACP methyl ester carboxylesterase